MEEIIERLRKVNQQVPVPLELPTFDDFVDAQEALLIHIPDEFRDFLMQVSDVVYGSLEPATIADPTMHTYLPEMAASAWDSGLERDLLPICQLVDGFYAINQEGTVSIWPEQEEAEWQSIWHWVTHVWLEQ